MHAAEVADETTVRDPVCGMAVDPASARHVAEHAGERFHFCSERCRVRFVAEPEVWLGDG